MDIEQKVAKKHTVNIVYGESIEIGIDAINRQSSKNSDLDAYVAKILTICKGNITGKLYQMDSISKDGVKIFQKERKSV